MNDERRHRSPRPNRSRSELAPEPNATSRWVAEGRRRIWPEIRPRPVYVILGAIVVAATLASLVYPHVDVVDRFLPNLASEAFGILLTLVFVHRFLLQQDRARRLRASLGALRRAKRELSAMIETWGTLIKGSLRHPPDEPPARVEDLFAPGTTDTLLHVDPRRPADAGGAAARPCAVWAAERLTRARDGLRDIVEAYGGSLDPAYVEALDELGDDPFLQRVVELAQTDDHDARAWRLGMSFEGGPRETHFVRLLWALEAHNALASEAARIRSRRAAAHSALGTRLTADHDLRVSLDVDEGWWRGAPEPGSLRAGASTLDRG